MENNTQSVLLFKHKSNANVAKQPKQHNLKHGFKAKLGKQRQQLFKDTGNTDPRQA